MVLFPFLFPPSCLLRAYPSSLQFITLNSRHNHPVVLFHAPGDDDARFDFPPESHLTPAPGGPGTYTLTTHAKIGPGKLCQDQSYVSSPDVDAVYGQQHKFPRSVVACWCFFFFLLPLSTESGATYPRYRVVSYIGLSLFGPRDM